VVAVFDPVRVGDRESEAWASYYRHEWARFLSAAVGMVSAGFGMGRRSTLAGAWYVLRANQLWAPYPDNQPDGARAYMRRFYALVAAQTGLRIDPARAARLEVEWWRVHRERQHDDTVPREALVGALTALYVYVYAAPAAELRPAAEHRVEAMDLSDRWVRAGRNRADPLLVEERLALVASYTALHRAVVRQTDG
jgi:hypothetical protein